MVMLIVVPDISIPEVPNVKVLPVFMVIQPLPVVTSIPCHETFPPNPTVKPVLSEELFHCAMSPVPGAFPPVQLDPVLRFVALFALTIVAANVELLKKKIALAEKHKNKGICLIFLVKIIAAAARCLPEDILRFKGIVVISKAINYRIENIFFFTVLKKSKKSRFLYLTHYTMKC